MLEPLPHAWRSISVPREAETRDRQQLLRISCPQGASSASKYRALYAVTCPWAESATAKKQSKIPASGEFHSGVAYSII